MYIHKNFSVYIFFDEKNVVTSFRERSIELGQKKISQLIE